MTKRVFEPMDETEIEFDGTGLRISQTSGADGSTDGIWIPARYVPEFLAECRRVAEGPLIAPARTEGLKSALAKK